MTDFWEILGRIVADTNFRTALFTFPQRNYQPPVNSLANIPADFMSLGTEAPNDDYDILRELIKAQPGMADKPYSVTSLGVMLYGLSFPEFRKRATAMGYAIAQSGVVLPPVTNSGFYTAMGAMTVDAHLRDQLVAGNWRRFGFYTLVPDTDKTTLAKLMNVVTNLDVVQSATYFCSFLWDGSCDNKAMEWAGYLQYVTPIKP
jgi:hypothetical protein